MKVDIYMTLEKEKKDTTYFIKELNELNKLIKLNNKRKKEEERREIFSHTYISLEKIVRTINVPSAVWDSTKTFAYFSQQSISRLAEKALMEYMVNHASELPIKANFNLVNIPEKNEKEEKRSCFVTSCFHKAEFILFDKQGNEHWFCKQHANLPLSQGWSKEKVSSGSA